MLRRIAFLSLLGAACVAACSSDENGQDDSGTLDSSVDAPKEAAVDAAKSDSSTDATTLDVAEDVSEDVSEDVAVDAPVESGKDATVDVISIDAPIDAPADVVTLDAIVADASGCISNAGCALTEYCAKANGDCNGVGTCTSIPFACPFIVNPVCGCDNVSYTNACFGEKARTSVNYAGNCE